MIKPAILYKDEIKQKMLEYIYTDDMMYYSGWIGNSIPSIEENTDGNLYQYAIVDNDNKLIGYFTYYIDWYSSCVRNFGMFSFDRNNRIIGFDIHHQLKKIINEYHIHRMEWRMVGGNPVERHYDSFCKRYNGKKLTLTDVIKDRCGKYHDNIIYEIIFDDKNRSENND